MAARLEETDKEERERNKGTRSSYKACSEAVYLLAGPAMLCCRGEPDRLAVKSGELVQEGLGTSMQRSSCSQAASQTMLRWDRCGSTESKYRNRRSE